MKYKVLQYLIQFYEYKRALIIMWECKRNPISDRIICLLRNFMLQVTNIFYSFLNFKNRVIEVLCPGHDEKCDQSRRYYTPIHERNYKDGRDYKQS